ncbi:uncharacterized protein LOC135836114 isoform X2 [Planococcus citri]|uniref:uncharacterized protein LOC135836114 isoform X2 n=1 Tax=Planococcus citri TaxID=170843 RepID=UPI0031F96EDC
MATAAGSQDKTVNKVALCSAIFAGFAYVGYSAVRTAFGKKGKRDSEGEPEHRLYFRRLSQTTQTDVLLGNLDMSGSGKVMLRSLTVQERIRELNLRARMFTDTMLAIQGSSRLSHPRRVVAKSLQGSPWSSPRILSPVDVQHIINSRSSENLHMLEAEVDFHTSSPMRRRWARRSFRKKSPSPAKSRNHSIENSAKHEEAVKEAEKLLKNNEDEMKARLEMLSLRNGMKITRFEAKSLVALLHSKDNALLERTLTTIGNHATFEENQNMFREAGCLVLLAKLVNHHKYSVRLAAISTLSNMVLNRDNQKELKDTIPKLITTLKQDNLPDDMTKSILLALSNFAVLPDWHSEFFPVLHTAYQIVDKGSPAIKLQTLKLLINLSCNEDMIPSLLAAQAPRRLIYFLDESVNEEILLRVLTLLANLTQAAKAMQIDPTIDLPPEDKAASPDTMYAAVYGVNAQDKLPSKLLSLMNKHKNEDIRSLCKKILDALPQ